MMKNRRPITLQKIEGIGKGKFRVKIKETSANILDMRHNGKDFIVLHNLGRGRYIMREVDNGQNN